MRAMFAALSALVFVSSSSAAQTPYKLNPDADRAQQHYRLGWDAFRIEHWSEAVKEFKQAVEIDPKFKLAYYGLGRSYMGLKQFTDASIAYERCRSLYESEAADKFRTAQEADLIRQADLDQLRVAINALSPGANSSMSGTNMPTGGQSQIRQLREQAQRIQTKRDALNNNLDITSQVPSFVSLSLGSAYFRATRFADAEKAFKDALDADPKAGEAWNNLAALFLFTDRVDEAERAVAAAEKTGYKVNPAMKDDIRKRRKAGGNHW